MQTQCAQDGAQMRLGMRGWKEIRAENAEASTLREVGEPRISGSRAPILKIPSEGRAETPCDLSGKRLRTRGDDARTWAAASVFHKFPRPSGANIEKKFLSGESQSDILL
jgi:hypothetical protein